MNHPLPAPLRPQTRHQIELLSWSSRASSRAQAEAHQARLSQFLNGPGLATIARVFNRASPPGEVWQLDTLEIDTGPLAVDGSFSQWADCLAEQLWSQLLRARQQLAQSGGRPTPGAALAQLVATAPTGQRPRASSQHALENFLYYLVHGHLPWSVSPLAGRELSGWLTRLAQRTGPQLWTLLQQLRPGDYVLARLSQITPHQGLQALLAVRHRELADSLLLLDAQILAPLQARGRLSAYQLAQLQQAWRVAGLRALWGQRGGNLSADRLRQLQQSLAEALVQQLGLGWRAHWRPRRQPAHGSGNAAELGQLLLGNLLGQISRHPGRPAQETILPSPPDGQAGPSPTRLVPMAGLARPRLQEHALQRMQAALDGSAALDPEALQQLLYGLAQTVPQPLQTRLQTLALQSQWRQQHASQLDAVQHWQCMLILSGQAMTNTDLERHRGQAHHWQETLRQYALGALAAGAQPAAGQGAGLSALQAWLRDYSLRQLALGVALPRDALGWARLWRAALAEWQAPAPPTPPTTLNDSAEPTWPPRQRPSQMLGHGLRHPRLRPSWCAPAGVNRAGERPKDTAEPADIDWPSRYAQALQRLASRPNTGPSAALLMRWQAQIDAWRDQRPSPFSPEHLVACQQHWAAELGHQPYIAPPPDTAQAEGSRHRPVLLGEHSALAQSASTAYPAREAHGEQDMVTPSWLTCSHRHAWQQGLRLPLAQRRAALAPYLESQAWCWQVAQHWSRERKQALLVLLSHPPLAEGQRGEDALASWNWLSDAIACCARWPAADKAAHSQGWRDKALQDWLWVEALRWVYQVDTAAPQAAQLYEHWHARAGLGQAWPGRQLGLAPLRARLWRLRTQPSAQPQGNAKRHEADYSALTAWLAQGLRQLLPEWSDTRRKAWHGQLLRQANAASPLGTIARAYAAALAAQLPARFAGHELAMQALATALAALPDATAAQQLNHAPGRLSARVRRAVLHALQAPAGTPRTTPIPISPAGAFTAAPAMGMAWIKEFTSLPRGQRSWSQRLQLQRHLADPGVCRQWLAASRSRERWSLLAALFPADFSTLSQGSAQLLRCQAELLPQRAESARLASHWAFLADYLFICGLPIKPDLLQRRYALHLCREDWAAQGSRSASLTRWLWQLGQCLARKPDGNAQGVAPAGLAPQALRRAPSLLEQTLAQQAPALSSTPLAPMTAPAAAKTTCHYLDNAGLVLLATYSQRLFSMLALLDGKQWRDAVAQAQGVRCLAYLVDGHEAGREPEWLLPKLLCGVPLAQPLPDTPALSPAMRETLDGLLLAVIAHWRALGSTSPAGLRQTFLQREGRLTLEDGEAGQHWQLAVKRGPFDMLLDRLPWSFSTIKLPWMREVLYVDWH